MRHDCSAFQAEEFFMQWCIKGETQNDFTASLDLSHSIDSTKVWSDTNIKYANEKNKTKLVTGPIFTESHTKVSRSAVILEMSILIRLCMANAQALPVQFVCHTKPYKNYNFQIDGTSRYFGVWLWHLVHLLSLVCSFQCVWPSFIGAVLSVINKVYSQSLTKQFRSHSKDTVNSLRKVNLLWNNMDGTIFLRYGWNNLPETIKESKSYHIFKSKTKRYLLLQ